MWVSVKSRSCYRKEKQDTLILDTCNIISFFYCLLRKERGRQRWKKGSAFPSSFQNRSLWCGCPVKVGGYRKGRKGHPKHSKKLGQPFLHAKLFTLYRMKRTKVREDKEALFFQGFQKQDLRRGCIFNISLQKRKRTPETLKKTWTPLFTYYIRYSYSN